MTSRLAFLLLLFGFSASAQVYNRSLVVTGNQYDPVVIRNGGATYVSFVSGMNPGTLFSTVHKVNELGETVASDSLDSPAATGWSYPFGILRPSGFHVLPDSSFFLFGGYVDACDVLTEVGAFVIHYDKNLNRIKEVSFVDSLMSEEYQMFSLELGGYALTGTHSMIQLDDNLQQVNKYNFYRHGSRGTVYLSGDTVLRTSFILGNAYATIDSLYYFNFNTGQAYGANMWVDQPIYDLQDSSFTTWHNGKWFIYDKFTLQKKDSINLYPITGFYYTYADFRSEAIVVQDTQNYYVLSKDDFSLRASGTLASDVKNVWSNGNGYMYFQEPYLVTANRIESGQIHLESFDVDLPHAPLFDDLKLKLRHVNTFVTSRDTTLGHGRTLVETNSTWKVTVQNTSTDTLRSAKFTYSNDFDTYCGGPNTFLNYSQLQLAPQDSFSFMLSGLNYSNVTDSTDFTVFVNVAAVEANGNILGNSGWVSGEFTLQDVSIAESDFLNQNVEVFPNPTSDILNIRFQQKISGEISLCDISGKVVLSKSVLLDKDELYLDVSHLATGVYVLSIIDGTSVRQFKVIKK